MTGILHSNLALFYLGSAHFADAPKEKGTPVLSLEWRPPERGNSLLARRVPKLAEDRSGIDVRQVEERNTTA